MYTAGANPAAGVWVALFICALVGWSVNKISGRPRMNWAAWLSGWYFVGFLASFVFVVMRAADAATEFGRYAGLYLLPAVLSFLYARRWRRKHPIASRTPEMKRHDEADT